MTDLANKLQQPPSHLGEFLQNAHSALELLAELATLSTGASNYSFFRLRKKKKKATKVLRPVRTDLFIASPNEFAKKSQEINEHLEDLAGSGNANYGPLLDRVAYTAMQAHACAFDAQLAENAARRSTGVVFTALIRNILMAAGIDVHALSLALKTKNGGAYHWSLDIVANRDRVLSTTDALSERDLVVSCMTTTKDRLAHVFSDRLLLESYYDHPVSIAAVALHDIQRKGPSGVTGTFLHNVFVLNWTHLAKLQALYYLDIPPTAATAWFRGRVRPFHELVFHFPRAI